jgi:hypothetical protein
MFRRRNNPELREGPSISSTPICALGRCARAFPGQEVVAGQKRVRAEPEWRRFQGGRIPCRSGPGCCRGYALATNTASPQATPSSSRMPLNASYRSFQNLNSNQFSDEDTSINQSRLWIRRDHLGRRHPLAGQTDGIAEADAIDACVLAIASQRRYRKKEHQRYVARQACVICGRKPSDPNYFRGN